MKVLLKEAKEKLGESKLPGAQDVLENTQRVSEFNNKDTGEDNEFQFIDIGDGGSVEKQRRFLGAAHA